MSTAAPAREALLSESELQLTLVVILNKSHFICQDPEKGLVVPGSQDQVNLQMLQELF